MSSTGSKPTTRKFILHSIFLSPPSKSTVPSRVKPRKGENSMTSWENPERTGSWLNGMGLFTQLQLGMLVTFHLILAMLKVVWFGGRRPLFQTPAFFWMAATVLCSNCIFVASDANYIARTWTHELQSSTLISSLMFVFSPKQTSAKVIPWKYLTKYNKTGLSNCSRLIVFQKGNSSKPGHYRLLLKWLADLGSEKLMFLTDWR